MKKEPVQILIKGNIPIMALGSIAFLFCCAVMHAALKVVLFFNYLMMAVLFHGLKKMWKGEISHGKQKSLTVKKGSSWEIFIENFPSLRSK